MRQRIDISDVESATKIRAKYLRALENGEWDLLPGPTFVKSFLRTYADALGLDGKVLIEEYKLHHEHLSEVELQPIGGARVAGGRQRAGRAGRVTFPRGWLIAGLLVALLVGLYVVGVLGGEDGDDGPQPNRVGLPTTSGAATQPSTSTGDGDGDGAKPRLARLQIQATGQVYVCLTGAGGRRIVDGVILTNGARRGPYRSSRFRLALGNSEARLIVDGKRRSVPAVKEGIGYEITADGVRRLAAASWPTCQQPG